MHNNFPRLLTSFVGREAEVDQLTDLLHDPACRLLTVVGPGGMGKTRLAVAAATQQGLAFPDGIYFVPLQAAHSLEALVNEIGTVLGLPASGAEDLAVRLTHYVQGKELLLLLDNFEQLIAIGGAELLSAVVTAAPGLKLLLTSREVLNLQEEWLFPLLGLAYPSAFENHLPDLEGFDAVRLFAECVRRIRPSFALADEAADVVQICHLVGGMPLALELAAAWARILTCAEIVSEIKQGITILTTNVRNTPERHRSMIAIFNESWQQLSAPEQALFARLALFPSGFRRDVAAATANATLPLLVALVDKSLLRLDADGRYHIHELLRQYASEKLAANPIELQQALTQYGTYYARFLHEQTAALKGANQLGGTNALEAEVDNLRAAWRWAVAQGRWDLLHQSAQAWLIFCHCQSRFQEGATHFGLAATHLTNLEPTPAVQRVLLTVLVYQAWFLLHLRRLDEAQAVLERSRVVQQALSSPPLHDYLSDPALPQGIITYWQGNYAEVARLGQEALHNSSAAQNPWNRQVAYYLLGRAARGEGQSEAAWHYAHQALACATEVGDRWFLSFCHDELGSLALGRADYALAQQHFSACLELRTASNDVGGIARAQHGLGEIAWHQGSYRVAQEHLQAALVGHRQIHSLGGVTLTLGLLGRVALALGDLTTAQDHLLTALQTAQSTDAARSVMPILLGVGELLLRVDQPERGAEVVALVHHHPASDPAVRHAAQALLATLPQQMPATPWLNALLDRDLPLILQMLIDELPSLAPTVAASPPQSTPVRPAQPLIEPLTSRELEVLDLMAAGCTNQEIADQLIVVLGTVKSHTHQIFGKLGVTNRTQAVVRARELGLVAG